jgi:hypothetical protein
MKALDMAKDMAEPLANLSEIKRMCQQPFSCVLQRGKASWLANRCEQINEAQL